MYSLFLVSVLRCWSWLWGIRSSDQHQWEPHCRGSVGSSAAQQGSWNTGALSAAGLSVFQCCTMSLYHGAGVGHKHSFPPEQEKVWTVCTRALRKGGGGGEEGKRADFPVLSEPSLLPCLNLWEEKIFMSFVRFFGGVMWGWWFGFPLSGNVSASK